MRVALLITDLHPGGAPLRIARLARGLRDSGVEVHVGSLAPPGRVGDELRAHGVPVFTANARGIADIGAFPRLRRELRRIQPDVLHSTLFHANVAARLVGRSLGVPVLTSTATIEVERPWHILLERLTVGWDCGQIVNSDALAGHVRDRIGVGEDRIFRVPIGVEAGKSVSRETALRELGLAPGPFRIAWAGRMDPVKRVELLIAALRKPALQQAELLLIGDGPRRAEWQRLAENLGVSRRVHWLGWRDSPRTPIAAADLFALPSRTEGLPNAVLDAMAAGVPVVASDIPATRELVGVPARLRLVSAPSAWAEALAQIRDEKAERERLAAAAREWIEAECQPAKMVAAHVAIYQRVIGRP
ncbi:MAG: glycosyltransferase [Phycisphaerae bacterium]|nr:glycosyltransferase [Phycisphaerae bacterium]